MNIDDMSDREVDKELKRRGITNKRIARAYEKVRRALQANRPATVSEVVFIPGSEGECPECRRKPVKLGHVNLAGAESRAPHCIDCAFGPPKELWETCQNCGWRQPGDKCDKCGAEMGYRK